MPPTGLKLAERTVIDGGVQAIYRDSAGGRQLALLSGVPGETTEGAQPTGDRPTVRGKQATLLRSESSDTWFAIWMEGPAGEPCSQYVVDGSGLSKQEFLGVLAQIS
jgi:hypothetical protein